MLNKSFRIPAISTWLNLCLPHQMVQPREGGDHFPPVTVELSLTVRKVFEQLVCLRLQIPLYSDQKEGCNANPAGLVGGVPAHCREVELDDLSKVPSNPNQWRILWPALSTESRSLSCTLQCCSCPFFTLRGGRIAHPQKGWKLWESCRWGNSGIRNGPACHFPLVSPGLYQKREMLFLTGRTNSYNPPCTVGGSHTL